jgi:poly-gamma-glutamate synthesis protein (capsule biosynthesis protein)
MSPNAGETGRAARRASRRATRRRRVIRRSLLALGLAAIVAGGAVTAGALLRADDPDRAQARPTTTAATTTPTTTVPPATAPPRDPRRGNGQPVTFAFGGDVHFEGGLRSKLAADPVAMLAPIAPVLSAADVAVVNLETAITERGVAQDKEYTFRTPPTALAALGAAGVDAASMANNHGLDYGADGLTDSLGAKALTPSPAVIGIGANAGEAYTPYRVDVRGQRIAVIAATQVLDGNVSTSWTATDTRAGVASAKDQWVDQLLGVVQLTRVDSDTVVVFMHWGIEDQGCPSAEQQALAQQLVDAGADIVVGSHAHQQQGAGRLGTAFVDYGLGNFVFYNEAGLAGVSGVLQMTATGRDIDAYSWAPAHLRNGVPEPLPTGPDTDQAVADWNALRDCAALAP